MSWTEINKQLQELSSEQFIELLKGLHDLSAQNKAWLSTKLLPITQDSKYLEECRRKIIQYVYKESSGIPHMPRFREAKKVISEYRKSTSDLRGTLDLMLVYVERGHAFTNDFGDIDEPFYDALINMLERFAVELRRSPAKYELYELFRLRLIAMRKTSDIGWGYGDFIQETVDERDILSKMNCYSPQRKRNCPLCSTHLHSPALAPGASVRQAICLSNRVSGMLRKNLWGLGW